MTWIIAVGKILAILGLYAGLVAALERRVCPTRLQSTDAPRHFAEASRLRRSGRVA